MTNDVVDGNLRVSFSPDNNEEEIIEAVKILTNSIKKFLNASLA